MGRHTGPGLPGLSRSTRGWPSIHRRPATPRRTNDARGRERPARVRVNAIESGGIVAPCACPRTVSGPGRRRPPPTGRPRIPNGTRPLRWGTTTTRGPDVGRNVGRTVRVKIVREDLDAPGTLCRQAPTPPRLTSRRRARARLAPTGSFTSRRGPRGKHATSPRGHWARHRTVSPRRMSGSSSTCG